MPFLLTVPIPPSVNSMYANRRVRGKRGRRKSKRYLAWQDHAGKEIMIQRPKAIKGKFRVFLTMPKVRADPDNLIKPVLDILKNMGLIEDDSQAYCVGITVQSVPDGMPDRIVVSAEDVPTAVPITG